MSNTSVYCVVWNREANSLEACTFDALLQLNNASFLDDAEPRAVVRTGMSLAQASQFIRGFSALLAKRSIARLEALETAHG